VVAHDRVPQGAARLSRQARNGCHGGLDGPEPCHETGARTPNGNDYGKDLLRQHYEAFEHDHVTE
jgi:hypothetical protein